MMSLFQILSTLLELAKWVVLIHVLMSWLINFQVLNLRQPFVQQVWTTLNRILEPVYAPVRRVMPNLGGVDLAPLVVLFAIYALQVVLFNNMMM
jgi:YggT family protein